jgi:tetratricopeptide (TPR) repeat protein
MSGPAKAATIAQALPFLKEQQLAEEALRICGMTFQADLDDESAFRISVGMASLLPENHPLIPHLRNRLLVLAGDNATRIAQALDAIASIPQRKENLHELLRKLWNDGRGPVPAGLKLAQFTLMENDRTAAASIFQALLSRNELTPQNLTMLAEQADTAKMQDLALQCSGEALRRSPADLTLLFSHARCLHSNGNSANAAELLRKNALRMVLENTPPLDFAKAFFDINCSEDGMSLLEKTCALPPRGPDWPLRIDLAQRYITSGKIAEARNLLRQALANPQAAAGPAMVMLALQQGGLDKLASELDAVAATPGQRADAWGAAVKHLLKMEGHTPALALARAHPEILQRDPGFEKIIQSMETHAASISPAASPTRR